MSNNTEKSAKNKDEKIYSSSELHKELNRERNLNGLEDVPAVNPRSSTNVFATKDKSYKNAFDFFKKNIKND